MNQTIPCPKCGRQVMTTPGAAKAQCFGCGTTISAVPAAVAKQPKSSGGDKSSTKIAALILGLLALFAVLGLIGFALLRQSDPPEVTAVETPATPPPAAQPAEPLVPAYVATDEDRRLADTVSQANREQILQMWDQLIATTQKKLLIPRNSVMRNRVESMLSAIEEREITTMSALLQVDREAVAAVIQVAMADRATAALEQQPDSGTAPE